MAKNKYKLTTFEMMVERQMVYNDLTQEIFKSMKKVTRAIEAKIKEDEAFVDGTIEFDDISMQPNNDDMLFIDLRVVFPIGATIVTSSGKKVTISEDTSAYFNKEVIVGIPIEVTEMTSYKEICAALSMPPQSNKSNKPQQPEDAMVDGRLTERDAKAILLQARNPTGVKH